MNLLRVAQYNIRKHDKGMRFDMLLRFHIVMQRGTVGKLVRLLRRHAGHVGDGPAP
jgi:hypothetical protein